MNCFTHQTTHSVGVCKSCLKAVCTECAIDTGRGLACSATCEQEVAAINEITDKSKQIYGIGSDSKLPPTGILMYFFFSLVFTGFGIYNSIQRERLDYFTIVMGVGFFFVALISWHRNRKLNLNC